MIQRWGISVVYLIDKNDVVEKGLRQVRYWVSLLLDNIIHTYVNGDGMCVFMDTFQDSEALLLQELGIAPSPFRHLLFPSSFIWIIK